MVGGARCDDDQGITAEHLRGYQIELRRRGLKPSSVHAGAKVLRVFLNWCERMELITVNPARKVDLPKMPRSEAGGVYGRCAQLLEACEDASFDPFRDLAIILVLVDTGIRASELCALKVGDLVGARLLVRHGKGDKARPVFVGDVTQQALEDYLSARPGVWPTLRCSHRRNGRGLAYDGLKEILERLGRCGPGWQRRGTRCAERSR